MSDSLVVFFEAGDALYGLNAQAVSHVYENPTLNPLPLNPQEIIGIAPFRGRVLTLVSAEALLTAVEGKPEDCTSVLVLDGPALRVGLCVSKVRSISAINVEEHPKTLMNATHYLGEVLHTLNASLLFDAISKLAQ